MTKVSTPLDQVLESKKVTSYSVVVQKVKDIKMLENGQHWGVQTTESYKNECGP